MKSLRSGSILLESVIAITLIALALVGVSQLLVIAGHQQRMVERRRLASREAGNLLERIMARPFREITPENTAEVPLSPVGMRGLPQGAVEVRISASSEPVESRRVEVSIRWRNLADQREEVQLVGWKYAPPAEGP